MNGPPSHRRVSLKALLLLTAGICVALFFVISKEYSLPVETTTQALVDFQSAEVAQRAIGKQFVFELPHRIYVTCSCHAREDLDYLQEHELYVGLEVLGNTRLTIPNAIRSSYRRLPIHRGEFTAALEKALNEELGATGCKVKQLGGLPFK